MRKPGKRRRKARALQRLALFVKIEDVMAFKATREKERRDRLSRLTQLSEEYGGYEREWTTRAGERTKRST